MAHDIVLAPLAFQHRNVQVTDQPQTRRQIAAIMAITETLLSMTAPTGAAHPVDLAGLSTPAPTFPFFLSPFGMHFGFSQGFHQRFDRSTRRLFRALLDLLQGVFPLLPLERSG